MNRLRIGRGCQFAGLVLIVLALAILGFLLTRPPGDWRRSSRLGCDNNLKQIGLAFRTWAIDNDGRFPFNVSTNTGGTMEFCATGADGSARLESGVRGNMTFGRIQECIETDR